LKATVSTKPHSKPSENQCNKCRVPDAFMCPLQTALFDDGLDGVKKCIVSEMFERYHDILRDRMKSGVKGNR